MPDGPYNLVILLENSEVISAVIIDLVVARVEEYDVIYAFDHFETPILKPKRTIS